MNDLADLGWRNVFAAQTDPDCGLEPARVMAVHRDRVEVAGQQFEIGVPLSAGLAETPMTIGDWVLLDLQGPRIARVLDRFGVFKRGAAGTSHSVQLIAANVDTLFVVTSANRDFNVARLERYLAIAHDAGAFPVVVITKADAVEDVVPFVSRAASLSPGLVVEALDARDVNEVGRLQPWCEPGQTIALLGSSGVGKSTLINSLTGAHQDTQSVRFDDQRGRHTTTRRSMHQLPRGGWIIDTPGMRELQLVDVGDALDDVFEDVTALASGCRFADCRHESEPGCAVQSAIDAGQLDPERLRRYRKLLAEDRRNSQSLAEKRARDRSMGQFYKSVLAGKRKLKDRGG